MKYNQFSTKNHVLFLILNKMYEQTMNKLDENINTKKPPIIINVLSSIFNIFHNESFDIKNDKQNVFNC